jgi:hypothetical protein
MTTFVPLSITPVVASGKYQVGAILNVYDAQTLTPRTVYKDGLATIPWLQATPGSPVPAGALQTDGSGRIPAMFVVGNPYRVRCIAANGVQIFDIDNLPGDVAAGGGGGGGGAGGNTGDYVFSHTTVPISGRVRANGKTIGNAISGATERNNADTRALFIFLWPDTSLTVSGGRGANAAADFDTANKTITLPDINGRALVGIDGMGTTPTGRLLNALFLSGNASTLGSTGGEAAHALINAENATHGHTGTTLANAAFQMTFTTASVSGGTPAGTIGNAGSHNHGSATGFESANHTHDLSGMVSAGSHNHGGGTGFENASLSLNTNLVTSVSRTFVSPNGGNLGSFSAVADVTYTTQNPNVVPAHTHGIGFDGSHAHGGNTGNPSTPHTHAIGFDGTHTHAWTATPLPAHAHSGSTDLGGAHTHIFASDLSGGGAPHNNTQPFALATCYIVL